MIEFSKKSKADILSRWRSTGFLKGLKEGGVIEWRCAKSFELAAEYFLTYFETNNNDLYNYMSTIVFPFIRRCVAGSPRINSIIYPEEYLDFILGKRFNEVFEYVLSLRKLSKNRRERTEKIISFIEEQGKTDALIIESFSDIDSDFHKAIKTVRPFVDVEAELIGCICEMYVDEMEGKH